jgi:hypothetical protein
MRRNSLAEKKPLTPSEKRISYTTAPRETISQFPIRTKFTPFLPSCEKLRLGYFVDAALIHRDLKAS